MSKLTILIFVPLLLVACRKDAVNTGDNGPAPASSTTKPVTSSTSHTSPDTLADLSLIKIGLVLDSTNFDETALLFKKTASPNYDGMEDGKYFPGYGPESLASIAPDGTEMAIYSLPYTPGKPIPLYVGAKNDGSFLFKVTFERTIPADVQVLVRDNLLKDSTNLRTGNYRFSISKADTTTYGSNRFQLVLKAVSR